MTSEELATFIERRRRFVEGIGEGLAIVPAAQETARNSDVSHVFRQNSDFYFLTGFDEPDAVAVLNPAHSKERFVLFVRPRDREMEIWNGHRAGIEGAVADYGADAAYPVDQLDAKLREYAIERSTVYYRLGTPAVDSRVIRLVSDLRAARPRGFTTPVRIEDPSSLLHDLRLRHSEAELARERRARQIKPAPDIEATRFARARM